MPDDRVRSPGMGRYFLIFCLGFSLLGLGVWEAFLRHYPMEDEARVMGCLRLGGPEHHYFQENCEAGVATPAGEVAYHLNDDGFRARPRADFRAGAVALLGDSKVEGWWLQADETIGARLEQAGALGAWRELNLGIRYSGPTIQRFRLNRALANYPVRVVLWFLNGTDPADERLALSLAVKTDPRGAPLELSHDDVSPPAWLRALQGLVGNRSALLRFVQMKLYDREVLRRVTGDIGAADRICLSLSAGAADLRSRKIPLVAVLLPLGPNIGKFPYMNLVDSEEGSSAIKACLEAAAIPTIDLRSSLSTAPAFYWTNHRNMTPAGIRHLAELLAPRVKKLVAGPK